MNLVGQNVSERTIANVLESAGKTQLRTSLVQFGASIGSLLDGRVVDFH